MGLMRDTLHYPQWIGGKKTTFFFKYDTSMNLSGSQSQEDEESLQVHRVSRGVLDQQANKKVDNKHSCHLLKFFSSRRGFDRNSIN